MSPYVGKANSPASGTAGRIRFLTFSCYQRLPLLTRDRSRVWFVESLHEARQRLGFEVWAYVVMPEHVHLLVWLRRPDCSAARVLAAVKRPVAVAAKQFLAATDDADWLRRLTVQKGLNAEFRYWQKGGGYDEIIESDRAVTDIIDYIHANPVRRGLAVRPTDWRWSSARFYALGDRELFDVDLPKI